VYETYNVVRLLRLRHRLGAGVQLHPARQRTMVRGMFGETTCTQEEGVVMRSCDRAARPLSNRSLLHTEDDLMTQVEQVGGCWKWTGAVMGCRAKGGRQPSAQYQGERVHARRAAWAYRHGELPTRRLVTSCGDRWCVSPDHAKYAPDVTDEQVAAALADRKNWETLEAVARRLGVRRETLSRRASRLRSAK
jgi:hypothetical protein